MNGSSSTRDGHSVVLNDNGFEEEENHDSMDIDSEDEESPPQLVFTDGSCSDSNSQASCGNSSSPCQRSESCPSPVFQTCMPSVVDNKKDFVEELLVNGDMKSWIADNVEERRIQQIDDEEQEDLLSNTWKSDIRSPSNPVLECFEVDGMKKTACGTGSLSENANDALMAMVPCTSFSPNLTRDEVDMDVSSGDEADECNHIVDTHETVTLSQIEQKHQTTSEEKKRIEENIQALMKEFERKRFEEKVRRAAEVVSNLLKQRPVSSMVSTTSESPLNDKAELKITPTLVSSPTSVCCTDEDHQQKCESQSMDYEKNDVSCELPSSSIDVPPVPSYEEIEQCIYKVESKKKAVSLMCFCRGNNLDCSDGRCDNRAMFTECPKNCLGKGNDCKNRRFAKREYAAVQAFYTGPSKGFGVQATAPIKKGQFIIEYVGEVVSSEEFAKRLKRYGRDPSHTHHYMFEIGSMIIDATKKGNCSRFMNHSCEPNAVCEKWYVPRTPCAIDRIGFFAKRDIELGEEITFDYQFENYGREAQRCFCGAAACSGWIGKPPELSEDDLLEDGMGSEIEDTEESADEDSKSSGRFLPPCKKTHRYSDNVVVTASEINDRLSKALGIGCRNKTHVLSWIKLMTEMTLIRREERMVQSMHRIVEAISSVDTSLQHIFVANGLPNIFKSWLRTSCPDMITRDDLNLKQCIIRTLLAMQSSAEAINARAPDLLPMVSDLVSLPLPDSLSVKDVMDDMVCKITGGEDLFEPNRYHESLELGFERVRNAAIRLQAVLQQHVNFRIPKKKAKGIPERSGDQLSKDNGRKNLRTDNSSSVSLCENSDQVGCASPVPNCMDAKTVQTKPRVRVSRWSSDYRPKRRKSASKERCDIEVIRCRIDPPMTAIRPSNTTIELTSAKRSRTIEDEPVIVTTVIPPSWPQPTNIPPPPPPQLLSPSQIMVPPPPPTVPPVYPAVIPFYDYGSYGGPPIPTLPNYQTYEYSLANEEFDSEEYRKFYETCEISLIERRLQILTEEMLILQSIRDQKMKKVEVESPLPQSTLQPSTTKTPPPPPPPHKEYMWKKAVDEDGAKYYYHKETRESVWELPDGEDSDPAERTPTRMPDTSGCGNDPEPDNMKHDEGSILSRWSAMCSPQVSTSSTTQTIHSSTTTIASESVNRALHANERKRDRDRRIWEKFETDTDRKRAKKLMSDIETVVGPIIVHHIGHRNDATKKKREWIIKQVSKEMLKRESERSDFNFILTEKGSKRVTDYANAFIQRKCAKEPKDLWKGYDGSP